ncbi:MAG: hypothetical protein M3Q40_05215 [Pseudomonadota bacterium]|nr:hypothetical protein [Pseudomonadota bacterium]
MNQIRNVPIGAGAEWLLGGFALLRRAPLALGTLGLLWGALSALVAVSGMVWLNLVMFLLGPILLGGLIYAAREVDLGRRAEPGHLLQGPREGKVPHLLAMLLPQIAALLVLALLAMVLFGAEQLQQMALVIQQMQTNPDPALASTLPAGRMLAWLALAIVVGILAGFFTFVAIPEVMFTATGPFAAMATSLRACLRNLGAIIVLIVLLFIAVVAISIAVQLVVLLLAWATGPQPAMVVGQLLTTAVLMPIMAGTFYCAWKHMVGGGLAQASPVTADAAGGFEA